METNEAGHSKILHFVETKILIRKTSFGLHEVKVERQDQDDVLFYITDDDVENWIVRLQEYSNTLT